MGRTAWVSLVAVVVSMGTTGCAVHKVETHTAHVNVRAEPADATIDLRDEAGERTVGTGKANIEKSYTVNVDKRGADPLVLPFTLMGTLFLVPGIMAFSGTFTDDSTKQKVIGYPLTISGAGFLLPALILGLPALGEKPSENVNKSVVNITVKREGYLPSQREIALPTQGEFYVRLQPEPDQDEDGISDRRDQCPSQPGSKANRGCPVERPAPPPERTAAAVAPPPPPPPASTGSEFAAGMPQPATYAFVVGIGHYRDRPSGAAGARADAESFARLAGTTLGIPPSNLQTALDDRAARSDIDKGIAWLGQNAPAGGRIIFYFSGLGAPETAQSGTDPQGTQYLLPYDGDPSFLSRTAIKLSAVVEALSATRAKEVLVLVDAGFSGQGDRSVLPTGARPLVRTRDVSPSARVALFTAAGGNQQAGSAGGGTSGLFTSHVIAALGGASADSNGDAQITLGELRSWVSARVERDAKQQQRDQSPSLVLGSSLGNADSFVLAFGVRK